MKNADIIIWPHTKEDFYEYLVSLVKFDGYIDSNKRAVIYDPEHSFLDMVGRYAKMYFGANYSVVPRHNYNVNTLRIYGKNLVSEIKQELINFKLRTLNHVRGLFDAEGSIYNDGFGLRIEIKLKDRDYIKQLSKILSKFGIANYAEYDKKYFDPRKNKTYVYSRLRIRAYNDLIRFIKIVGIRQERKLHIHSYLESKSSSYDTTLL